MTVRLRAHHLLCLLTYIGKGYSPAFIDNMTVIAGRISAGEGIEIIEGPDDICAPRQAETDAHCGDKSIHDRDRQAARDVGRILQIKLCVGATLSLDKHRLNRLRAAFAQDQVRSACRDCQWGDICTAISTEGYQETVI
jgi:hypothetical protein